jgi:hypothetical protein
LARFFFHLHDDLDVPDEEGADLPDLDAARVYACQSARSLMCGTLLDDCRISLDHCIDIEDEGGAILAVVRFSDAVRMDAGEPCREPARKSPQVKIG